MQIFLKIKKFSIAPFWLPFPTVESLATGYGPVLTISLLNYLNIILS